MYNALLQASHLSGSVLVADLAVKVARMAATIQQLQQQNTELQHRDDASEERCQAVTALELQEQEPESTNTELCKKNTQLQHSLRDSNQMLFESYSELDDLEAQQVEQVKQVLLV
jgi:chromosome segregation ATPase